MLDTAFPIKTPSGHAEVGQRKHKLGSRQRVLLIAIHGGNTVSELRQQFRTLGDVNALLDELAAAQLISLPPGKVAAPAAGAQGEQDLPPVPAARQFMNETVVSQLGLRAFLFTLKIERCYSRQELTDLLPEYRRMLGKSLDEVAVKALSDRAEALIAKI